MLKGYEYNQICRNIVKKTKYDYERGLLHEFLASENENIRLEYDSPREACNAAAMLKLYVKNARQPLEIKQRGNAVFAFRNEVDS